MNTPLLGKYIKLQITEDDPTLFSPHFIEHVLPYHKAYTAYDPTLFISEIEALAQTVDFNKLALQKEVTAEFNFLTKVLAALNLQFEMRPNLDSKELDYALYDGDEFFEDFTNTIGIVEAKRNGRIANHYYEKAENLSDIVYQTRYYLREVNVRLANKNAKQVDFAVLTDGFTWRLYNRAYTHSPREFEKHFFELNLVDILQETDAVHRHALLKLFAFMFNKSAWQGKLQDILHESISYGQEVTEELKRQVYTAHELIATGLWRNITKTKSYTHALILKTHYNIDPDALDDEEVKNSLLKVVYDESLIFLLRLLFILYAEDRGLFAEKRIIKGHSGFINRIASLDYPIGQIPTGTELELNFDVKVADHCRWIDDRYNGGMFSAEQHPLLEGFNIDDELFANAVDNLCRVQVGKTTSVVDFSSIGVRELGTIYEGLLEYKLAIQKENVRTLVSIVDRKKVRLDVRAGDLYLINHNGERKATGSYYTHDTIVDYLVERTITKRVNEIIEKHGNTALAINHIMELKIVDPAMGSGHFLLAAFDALVHQTFRIIEDQNLSLSRETVKTQLARRCIYGVDMNPVAVELAKMVLWIKIFSPDKPFEFFDYNLACGNSLIGVYDEGSSSDDSRISMFRSIDEIERDTVQQLDKHVEIMLSMPRETKQQVEEVKHYHEHEVQSRQDAISVLYNLKLVKFLDPENHGLVIDAYEDLLKKIETNPKILGQMATDDENVAKKYGTLAKIAGNIAKQYRPLHWKIAFPHVFLQGGFDVVLGNPPWDLIKSDHNDFFSDYIDGYAYMDRQEAKSAMSALCATNPRISSKFENYKIWVTKQNQFFSSAYVWQAARDANGNLLSSYNNLYKIFIEKAYTIVKPNGLCGYVVPSGLNSDQGCTGLRRLLFTQAAVEELIMFENRRKLFPSVDSRFKFDVLTFAKRKSRKKSFTAGFYWQNPEWLIGAVQTGVSTVDKSEKRIHERFTYPVNLIEILSPETEALIEIRSKRDIPIIEKMAAFPLIGDQANEWFAKTYQEFNMTFDAPLFNTDQVGYPLYEGKCIHQFNAYFGQPTYHIASDQGEDRLKAKWRLNEQDLPNRTHRIAWRDISQSTNTRTLIATMLPKYTFCGNTLNILDARLTEVQLNGLLAILNSLTVDYLVRFMGSTHVNMFNFKHIPIPNDPSNLHWLGTKALPLLYGRDFDQIRGNVPALDIEDPKRLEMLAEIDAIVARTYGITYEEMQHIARHFPLVDKAYMEEVLHQFRLSQKVVVNKRAARL